MDAALAEVSGEAQTIDTTSFLAQDIDAASLAIKLSSVDGFSRGMVQIDDELMLVSTVDRDTSTLHLEFPSARGVRGTGVAPHLTGALVTMSPSVPRWRAVRAVAETITSSPGLFRVDRATFPMRATQAAYSLPGDAEDVLHVSWQPSGPTLDWLPMRRWSFDKFNRHLVVGDAVEPGRDIRVDYSARPIAPPQDVDFGASGLPETCLDVIRFGAAWRMVAFIEPYNLLARSAEAEAMDRAKTPQSRLRVSQYLYGLYTQRLAEEVQTLNTRYPIRVHHVGRW